MKLIVIGGAHITHIVNGENVLEYSLPQIGGGMVANLDPKAKPDGELLSGGYLAFLGRISPEKRPDLAIRAARRAGIPLRIAAKVDAVDRVYFEQEIEPLLADPLIDFMGEIGDAEKPAFLGEAAALIFPIDWPEPFGLVMIEALACGTPVIARACGSVPELIVPGRSGLIADTVDELALAARSVDRIDRAACRREAEARFSAERMADGYEAVYERLEAGAQLA